MGRKSNLLRVIEEHGRYRLKKEGDVFAIKRKGGLAGSVIKADSRFDKSEEESLIFKECAERATLFREALSPLLKDIKDEKLNGRLIALMRHVKKEGEVALQGFEFNSKVFLKNTLTRKVYLHEGSICLKEFVAIRDVNYPNDVTHIILQGAFVYWDMPNGKFVLVASKAKTITLTKKTVDISLLLRALKKHKGNKLCIFKISFLKNKLVLDAGRRNAMAIVG